MSFPSSSGFASQDPNGEPSALPAHVTMYQSPPWASRRGAARPLEVEDRLLGATGLVLEHAEEVERLRWRTLPAGQALERGDRRPEASGPGLREGLIDDGCGIGHGKAYGITRRGACRSRPG